MNIDQLQKQVDFIHEIDKIKYIQRKTRLFNSDRTENDAEHSWHLALMALVLSEHSNEVIDLFKVIKMLLIHDLVEIDAGDIFLYDNVTSHKNTTAELAAARRIFGLLPQNQTEEFILIWEEFEAGETAESKFARAMDRFEPLLQNRSNKGGTWKEFDVPYNKVIEKKGVIKKGSHFLWKYAKKLIDNSVKEGILQKVVTK
jgi:putative hydrolase of HD superfamily